MSASIRWRPTGDDGKPLTVGGPSAFMEAMSRARIGLPCTLTESDIPLLNGMAAMLDSRAEKNPYDEIVDLIEKFGSVDLWAIY